MFAELTNHLWQSTIFVVPAGMLALALRKNRAQVRYWVWLAASVKFLVPFALLMSLGSHVRWAPKTISAAPAVAFEMAQIAEPFPETVTAMPSSRATYDWISVTLLGVWICGFFCIAVIRFREWLRIRAAVGASSPIEISSHVEIRSAPGLLEPGVVGVFQPVLLLPDGIAEHLTAPQLEAVMAHELCHVRRRDNLFAAIHMIVEALFWFHPLVWWIGGRLVEERERACDEEVLRLGSEPRVYAEGILSVCMLYVESPLACVSGVTGSDLKERIENIMTKRTAQSLNRGKKLLLATAGFAALTGPILIGIGTAPAIRAQSSARTVPGKPLAFDVASIKPYKGPTGDDAIPVRGVQFTRGGVTGQNITAREMILSAFGVTDPQLSGGPSWLDADTFALEGKAESHTNNDQLREMLQTLLAERFKLVVHRETKEALVYFLTIGKNGPKLKEWKDGEPKPNVPRRTATATGGMWNDRGTIQHFADHLSSSSLVGRPVLDRTGLPGIYLLDVEWETGDDIMQAVEDKFGLKFESQKAPVDVIVIDRIEKPTAN